jgi:hypothetical protein
MIGSFQKELKKTSNFWLSAVILGAKWALKEI